MIANIIVVSTLDSVVLFHFYYYYAVLELYFLPASFELVSDSLFVLFFFALGCIVH